jgi:hypothetical protein
MKPLLFAAASLFTLLSVAAQANQLTCSTVQFSDPSIQFSAKLDYRNLIHLQVNLCHEQIDDCDGIVADQVVPELSAEYQQDVYSLGTDTDGSTLTMSVPVGTFEVKGSYDVEISSQESYQSSVMLKARCEVR